MKLTLHKQTEIEINMNSFIGNLLHMYRLATLLDGYSFNHEICYVIKDMTMCDPRDYDDPFYVIQTVMNNAYIYATEHDYSQTDIDTLKEIIDRM